MQAGFEGSFVFVERPACKTGGDDENRHDPERDRRMHAIDADQRDKDGAAGAAQHIRDQEAPGRDGRKPCHIAHQVAGEDRQDEGEEIEEDALVFRGFVPPVDDRRARQACRSRRAHTSGRW